MARAQRKAWKTRQGRKALTNGHVKAKNPVAQAKNPVAQAKMARDQVIELAKDGARQRLQAIEREAVKLRIFLGEVPK